MECYVWRRDDTYSIDQFDCRCKCKSSQMQTHHLLMDAEHELLMNNNELFYYESFIHAFIRIAMYLRLYQLRIYFAL